MQKKSFFTLHVTHEFSVKTGTASKSSQKYEPATDASTARSLLTSSIGQTGYLAEIVTTNKDSTKAFLEHYKSNAVYIDMSTLMADFHTAWGLN